MPGLKHLRWPMARYNNILETIGNTPVVKLNRLAPPGVNVYVKIEAFNPMGSVKDRMARAVIEDAERSGALKPGQTVIEATSGNTGIGLAMVCAQTDGWFLCRQFENPANAEVHSRTTAREILRDFAGTTIDYFVTGFGTGGTLQGVARVLKQESRETRVIAAEPDNAPVLASGIA